MSTTSAIIGRQADNRSIPVHLEASARARSTYVIGIQGTGKSTLLESVARWDMANGDGLVFLDPHSTSVLQLLDQVPGRAVDDVIYWNPADRDFPFGLNPFYCPNPDDYDRRADNFISALSSVGDYAQVFSGAARMKDLLHHLALAFVVNQGSTLSDAARFLTDGVFRRRFFAALDRAGYGHIREYWEEFGYLSDAERERRTESSLNKLRPFQRDLLMRRIFSQPTPSIDMRWAMDTGKIVLVNLNREALGEENASLIGAFIIHDLLTAALSRVNVAAIDRRPFHIIADEFQLYMSTAFSMLISEGRKFGVDVMVAHQFRAQLSDARTRGATTAVGNLIVFQVNGEDARELSASFDIVIPAPTVTNLKPRKSFSPAALRHIQEHGHVNGKIIERYQALVEAIEAFISYAQNHEFAEGENYSQVVDTTRAHYTRLIDAVLYDAMNGTPPWDFERLISDLYDPLIPTIVRILGPAPDNIYRAVDSYYRANRAVYPHDETYLQRAASARSEWMFTDRIDWSTYVYLLDKYKKATTIEYERLDAIRLRGMMTGELLDHLNEWKKAYLEKHVLPFWPKRGHALSKRNYSEVLPLFQPHRLYWLFELELEIASLVVLLASDLKLEPAFVSTGQMEPAQEQVRTHADVQAEIANALANLPRYHARCKLATSTGTTETTITTIPFDPNDPMSVPIEPPSGRPGNTRDVIIEHSRRTYGHPVSSTTKDTSPGILNQQDDRHDDDGPIFGEKGSAPKT